MDPEISNVLQAAYYSAAGFGSVYVIAKYYTHKINTKTAFLKELMNNPVYKDWMEKREKLAREFIERDPKLVEGPTERVFDHLQRTLDAVVGNITFRD
jgi:hypothetical protein